METELSFGAGSVPFYCLLCPPWHCWLHYALWLEMYLNFTLRKECLCISVLFLFWSIIFIAQACVYFPTFDLLRWFVAGCVDTHKKLTKIFHSHINHSVFLRNTSIKKEIAILIKIDQWSLYPFLLRNMTVKLLLIY